MNPHIIPTRLLALFVMISVTSCAQATATSLPLTPIPSATSIPPTFEIPSPTVLPTTTPSDTKPVWQVMENWTLANQIRTMLIDKNGDLWTGGPAGVVHWDLKTNTPTVYAIRGNPENTNVVALSQTPDGIIWAGTFGNGLAMFDGTGWQNFITKDELPGNYIISQTVSSTGELWVYIRKQRHIVEDGQEFTLGKMQGNEWLTEGNRELFQIVASPNGSIVGTYNYPWPGRGASMMSKVSIYDEPTWSGDYVLDGWISAVTVAPDGVIWVATLESLYVYMNQEWLVTTPPWIGREGFPAVSSIAVSRNEAVWFGFSHTGPNIDPCGSRADFAEEYGVYRFDEMNWTNFTTDDGLIDNKICAITIDSNDTVWFGSFDKGVSRFDGQTWISYVIP